MGGWGKSKLKLISGKAEAWLILAKRLGLKGVSVLPPGLPNGIESPFSRGGLFYYFSSVLNPTMRNQTPSKGTDQSWLRK